MTFHICSDDLDEPNETILYTANVPDATVTPAVLTIGDPETITLSVSPGNIAEEAGATEATVTATLSEARATDTLVNLTLGGTAEAPADYTATSLASITIPKGQTSADGTLTITPADDGAAEGDETITVSGESGPRPVSSAQIIITDPVAITLSFNPEYVQEGSDVQVTLTATRNSAVGDHTLDWSGGWRSQTATDGTDYTQIGSGGRCGPSRGRDYDYIIRALPTDVRIAPGESSASTTVTYHICSDELDEPNETIFYTAIVPGATVTPAVLTIGDPETITLSVSPGTVAEKGGATEVTVTATLSEARAADTLVNLTLGGTADDPADYTASALASITIPKDQTSADGTLTITPVDDATKEGEETITVSGESGARTVSPADITITDTYITLSVDPEYVQEGQLAKRVTLTATRDGTEGDHTISLSVGGGTATDGTDYTILTFSPAPRIAPGETSTTFTLTFNVIADSEDEGNETVILSGTSPGAVVGDAVVTIGQPESITLSVSPDSIAEGAGATEVTVTATLSAARETDTVVNLTLGGTADDPADYTATSLASITIPKGETSADGTLTITPVVDTAVEGDETITVSGESGARTVSSADITVTDNEAPVISFETAPASVNEGSNATYTVKLEGDRTTNVTVRFKTGAAGDLATAGQDYTAVDSTITFAPTDETKTVTVRTIADTRIETPERLHRLPLPTPRAADAWLP